MFCDFLRARPNGTDPDLYDDAQSLGIFCPNDDFQMPVNNLMDGYDELDTDSDLWKIAKLLGITSLLLGLIGCLVCFGLLLFPNVILRNAQKTELIWHCLSLNQCIAAIMEIWALLPYASDVCTSFKCSPGVGTYLLGVSFIFYFLTSLMIELSDPPFAVNSSRELIEANRQRMLMEEEKQNKPPQSIGSHMFSPSVVSNVSSITGASVFLHMELNETDTLIKEHMHQQQVFDNASVQETNTSITNSDMITSWRNFAPLTLASTAGTTPDTSPLEKLRSNKLSFSPIESDDAVHVVKGTLPISSIKRQKSPTNYNNTNQTPLSAPNVLTYISGKSSDGRDTPTSILKKSRFTGRASPSGSSQWASPSPTNHLPIRLSASPEVRQQAMNAMEDPEWPKSLTFNNISPEVRSTSVMQGSIREATRLSQKKVRLSTSDKALADSSDEESGYYR